LLPPVPPASPTRFQAPFNAPWPRPSRSVQVSAELPGCRSKAGHRSAVYAWHLRLASWQRSDDGDRSLRCVRDETSGRGRRASRHRQKYRPITSNSPRREGEWGSLSFWAEAILVTDEGAFSMETHRSLGYMIMWTNRPHGKHRREPSPGVVRTQATRRIVVPALVIASLGGAVATVAGQSAAGPVHGNAHQSAQALVPAPNRPWIY
jgi:hypothetical protein